MTLAEYMTTHNLTDFQMAAMLSRSRSAVIKWRRNERMPRLNEMRRIELKTGGLVTANDFVGRSLETEAAQVASGTVQHSEDAVSA